MISNLDRYYMAAHLLSESHAARAEHSITEGMTMATKHPGFSNVAAEMARKQGIPLARAKAELAAATRKASPAARKANPRLGRVK